MNPRAKKIFNRASMGIMSVSAGLLIAEIPDPGWQQNTTCAVAIVAGLTYIFTMNSGGKDKDDNDKNDKPKKKKTLRERLNLPSLEDVFGWSQLRPNFA